MYDDEPQGVRDDEITPTAHPLLYAPDALAQAGPTHHHGADYVPPDTTVTVVDGYQDVHDGVAYGGGETVDVPPALAAYWFRSGWATIDFDAHAESVQSAIDDEPEQGGTGQGAGQTADGPRYPPPHCR